MICAHCGKNTGVMVEVLNCDVFCSERCLKKYILTVKEQKTVTEAFEDSAVKDAQVVLWNERQSKFKKASLHGHGNVGGPLGSRNGSWKGSNVSYTALQKYIRERLLTRGISQCDQCLMPFQWNCLDAVIKDTSIKDRDLLRDPAYWQLLCRRCHMKRDGRYKNLRNQL